MILSVLLQLQDDHRDENIKFEDLAPNEPNSHISYDNIKILLETLHKEIDKLVTAAEQLDRSMSADLMPGLQPSAVIQSVKLLAKIMGTVVTTEISDAIDSFEQVCRDFVQGPSQVSTKNLYLLSITLSRVLSS